MGDLINKEFSSLITWKFSRVNDIEPTKTAANFEYLCR